MSNIIYNDNFNYQLLNKIGSPCTINNINNCLHKINQELSKGKLLNLYNEFQLKYGDNLHSSNIMVPYIQKSTPNNLLRELIIINDPRDSERLVNKHVKKMSNLKELLYDSIISTTDITHWKCQRQNFQPSFSVVNKLEKLIPISNQRSIKCVETLWNLSKKGNQSVNINEFFLNETHAQLQLAMFGFSENFEEKNNKCIRDTFNGTNNEYKKHIIPNLLNEIKVSNGPLSQAFNNQNYKVKNYSELVGNALIFSFAGHDTTGNTLTWLIYELSKNKYYQNILQKEVKQFWINQEDKPIEYQDFKKLPFMTRCIMETLRLWNPLPNGTFRELIDDDYIYGLNDEKILLPKGTFIQIPNWSRHRNPALWGSDVNIFNPYRDFKDEELWNDSIINTYNPSTERFSPFTYGPRDCIGKNFSQIEMRLILLQLIKNFEFSLTKDQLNTYSNENMTFNTFTMGPRNIYNYSLQDNRLGMYVNIKKINLNSKL
jgi:cytochrome P450